MTPTMAILLIGDELLDGRIADQNGLFLQRRAQEAGVLVTEMRVIPDDLEVIRSSLEALCGVDLVVVSGGLGPTSDDLSRDAAAALLGVELTEEKRLTTKLQAAFEARGYRFTANNRKQCTFPKGSTILSTEVGTAAGFSFLFNQCTYFFFPGVPAEFQWFVDRYVPLNPEDSRPRRRLIFFGLGESDVETRIQGAVALTKDRGVSIGYRAESSLIEVILKGANSDLLEVERAILKEIGPWLVTEDEESFPERLARRLLENKATVSVAESCTAGLLGASLTELSGSSAYFEEGYLTYSNEAKEGLLGVDSRLLKEYGAVSKEVVVAMAEGARARSHATYALAISGIAGPTGGTSEKPVGTVDFGLATPLGTYYKRVCFSGRPRQKVRALSVHLARALLLWHLEGRLEEHTVEFLPLQ